MDTGTGLGSGLVCSSFPPDDVECRVVPSYLDQRDLAAKDVDADSGSINLDNHAAIKVRFRVQR